jgi:hypothetical protein
MTTLWNTCLGNAAGWSNYTSTDNLHNHALLGSDGARCTRQITLPDFSRILFFGSVPTMPVLKGRFVRRLRLLVVGCRQCFSPRVSQTRAGWIFMLCFVVVLWVAIIAESELSNPVIFLLAMRRVTLHMYTASKADHRLFFIGRKSFYLLGLCQLIGPIFIPPRPIDPSTHRPKALVL